MEVKCQKKLVLFLLISIMILSSIVVAHASGICPNCSSSDVDTISETISISEPTWTSIEWVSSPLRCNYCAKMGDGFFLYEGYRLAYIYTYDLCYDCGNMYNKSYNYVSKPAAMIEWYCPHCGRTNH